MKSALLLIDIQNDYFPGGKKELFEPEAAAKNAKTVLDYFRANKLPIFHIKHINTDENVGFFLPDTIGAEINKSVFPQNEEKVLIKHTPNAFIGTSLENDLRLLGIEQLVICGMMTHMCVNSTVRAASDLGFNVLLPEDACTTEALVWGDKTIPAKTVHQTVMASVNWVFARVVETESIPELLKI